MNKDILSRLFVSIFFICIFLLSLLFTRTEHNGKITPSKTTIPSEINNSPLNIEFMRKQKYPGSDFITEQTLADGDNYSQYIVSYKSEGLKIYGLLTVPKTEKPKDGFPAIIFNHGYIPPEEYKTTERYVSYVAGFARSGFVVFKPDYRGHGDSEGRPEGAYFSPVYTIDVLNALASVKKLSYVNPERIGMWGHSLGGNITQRALVVNTKDIKAAVIWGGVVGSYKNLFDEWWSKRDRFTTFQPSQREVNSNRPSRQRFVEEHGNPTDENSFWKSISPTSYIQDVAAPIQLHAGLSDETVPYALSQKFYDLLIAHDKTAEIYLYEGADHNLSQVFNTAEDRSINFFKKYLSE